VSKLRVDLDRRETVRSLGLLTSLLFASLVSGWLISRGEVKYLAALGAIIAMSILAVKARWLLVSLLVLATLNGLPGLNLSDLHSAGTFNPTTVCAMLLVAMGAAHFASGRSVERGRAGRWLFLWGVAFIAVWLVGWVRAVGDGVPIFKALTFGQTFLVFGLLLPVAQGLFRSRQELRRFLSLFIGLGIVYALGEIAASVGLISPSAINVSLTQTHGGITRLYAPMGDAVFLIFACSIGVSLLSKGRTARLALLAALVTGVAVAVELTRAQYFALVGGLVAALLIISFRGSISIKGRIGWRVLCAVGAGIAIVGVLALTLPQVGQSSAVNEVSSRVTTGIAQLTGEAPAGATNTFAYRQSLDQTMLAILGTGWPIGLGFLAPSTSYFAQLPSGSITNTDVGVMNVLMTLGAVGAVLLYLPMVCFLVWTARGLRHDDGTAAERLGMTIWVVALLAASVTLVTLFSTGGVVLVAVAIGVCLRRWGESPEHRPAASSGGAASPFSRSVLSSGRLAL